MYVNLIRSAADYSWLSKSCGPLVWAGIARETDVYANVSVIDLFSAMFVSYVKRGSIPKKLHGSAEAARIRFSGKGGNLASHANVVIS
jgi:hypothetical protein